MSLDPYYSSIPTFHSSCQNKPIPFNIVSIYLPSSLFEVSKWTIHLFHIFGILGWVSRLDRSNANKPLSSSETCRESPGKLPPLGWSCCSRLGGLSPSGAFGFSRNSEWQVRGRMVFLRWNIYDLINAFETFLEKHLLTLFFIQIFQIYHNFSHFPEAHETTFGYPDTSLHDVFPNWPNPETQKLPNGLSLHLDLIHS